MNEVRMSDFMSILRTALAGPVMLTRIASNNVMLNGSPEQSH
jgi:hypothetical protein